MLLLNKINYSMFLKTKIFITASFILGLPILLSAQNNSSPYSVLGIGDIENSYFNRYTGMANAGVALADERYINNSNAASLIGLRDHFFSFEVSTRFKYVNYTGANILAPDNKTTDFAVRRVNLAAKITKHWASSLGLMPFSTSNYNYLTTKNIQGTNLNVSATYEGDGGVSQFYWSNGFKITKNTSIGVTSSFLFGTLNQTETILSNSLATTLTTKNSIYLRNYYFNFSAQTKLKISKHWMSTYGITYSPKTNLLAEYSVKVTAADLTPLKQELTKNDFYKLPTTLNAGIAFIKDNKYTFTVNAQGQNWSALQYDGSNYQLVNSNKLSLGYQNSIKARNGYNQEYEKAFFQLGAYAGNSYIKINNAQVTDFGGSIGYGKNSKNTPLGYILSLEVGRRGTTSSTNLTENYFNLNLTLSFQDIIFKFKKN